MQCPKCGKLWDTKNPFISETYICPFCGYDFDAAGNERDNVQVILTKIVCDYGEEVLLDVQRTRALLMDYAPRSDKERKLIVNVLKENVATQLMNMKEKDPSEQDLIINRCIKQLVSDLWIKQEAADYSVKVIASALGIHRTIGSSEVSEQTDQSVAMVFEKESERGNVEADLMQCKVIGYKAFAAMSNLTNLTIPNTIEKIYPKAFLNCVNLKSINLPENLQVLGKCAFEGCVSLENIEIQSNKTYKVMNGILIDKKNKRTMRSLNSSMFPEVRIPDGIICISKKTFEGKSVKKIRIPYTVTEIEENAIYQMYDLEHIEVDSKNRVFRDFYGVLHSKDGKTLLKYPQGCKEINFYFEECVTTIGCQAFSCALNLQTLTFSGALKEIQSRAFEYCFNLERVILPGSVEIIGDRAFQGCIKLESMMLSKGIKEIGDFAFFGCESLRSISVPAGVTRIGNLAFSECKALEKVVIQDKVAFIGDGAFVGCNKVEVVVRNNAYVVAYCKAHGLSYVEM